MPCPPSAPPARWSAATGARGRRALRQAHSLLLERGLIRIFLPVPTGVPHGFTVAIPPADDRPGCNRFPFDTDRPDDPAAGKQIISMYRRPLISANLGFKVARDDRTRPSSVMWDGREADLSTQAVAATLGHAQAKVEKLPTAQEVAEIVRFETNFFSAQLVDKVARLLDARGAEGGPVHLSGQVPVPAAGLPRRPRSMNTCRLETMNSGPVPCRPGACPSLGGRRSSIAGSSRWRTCPASTRRLPRRSTSPVLPATASRMPGTTCRRPSRGARASSRRSTSAPAAKLRGSAARRRRATCRSSPSPARARRTRSTARQSTRTISALQW